MAYALPHTASTASSVIVATLIIAASFSLCGPRQAPSARTAEAGHSAGRYLRELRGLTAAEVPCPWPSRRGRLLLRGSQGKDHVRRERGADRSAGSSGWPRVDRQALERGQVAPGCRQSCRAACGGCRRSPPLRGTPSRSLAPPPASSACTATRPAACADNRDRR